MQATLARADESGAPATTVYGTTTGTTWRAAVRSVVEEVMGATSVPGLVIAVARGDSPPEHLVIGADASGEPLLIDTLFPVASITKMATALAVLRLIAAGRLKLEEPLAYHLPDAAAAASSHAGDVTLRTLLCHTGGLPQDLGPNAAPYARGLDWPALAHACLATPLEIPPQTQVRYSNLGSGLLAIVVERLTGQPFAAALENLVLHPLGVEGYLGIEPPRPPARLTGELGGHAGTELEPFNSAFWRALALPWGGLMTTAVGALSLVRAFGGSPADFLPADLRATATSDQAAGLEGGFWEPLVWARCPWGLGVELHGDKAPHWTPSNASPASFGHAGSSGCLAWADPACGVAWAMLAARTFEDWWTRWPAMGGAILAAFADQPPP